MFNQLVPLTPRTCYGTKILYNYKVSNTSFKIMGIIERFFESIEKAGISSYEIEKKYGVKSAQSKLSQLKEGKTKSGKEKTLPSDLLSAVCSAREDINPDYILTGRGTPLRQQPEVAQIFHPKSIEKAEEDGLITLYDVEAAANLKSLFDNKDQNILGQINIPNIPKCDGAVYVKGDSMYPLLKSGDIVAYKEVPLEMSHIFFGEMYLVSIDLDGDEYLTVKYVQHSEKGEDWIKLVSYNQNHQPKDFPLSSVRAMALVKLSIRMNTMK